MLREAAQPGQKPDFVPVPHSEFELPCDTLIYAIGQTQESNILPPGIKIAGRHETSRRGLFVAGDFSSGNADVINAVADGKSAAVAIDEFLMGRRRRSEHVRVEQAEITGRLRDHDLVEPPPMPVLPLAERKGNEEVELGLGPESTQIHAWRCYLCNYKFEIDQDKCIHCDWCIKVSPRDCIRRLSQLERDADGAPLGYTEVPASEPDATTYIWIDSDNCIRCGNCINICPVDAISGPQDRLPSGIAPPTYWWWNQSQRFAGTEVSGQSGHITNVSIRNLPYYRSAGGRYLSMATNISLC